MSLQDKLDIVRKDFESQVPHDALRIMHQSTNDLIASRQAERALKAGDKAPSFELQDADGNLVSSEALLKKGPLVATFYRGVWCPYCNFDLQALESARGDVEARCATLIGISEQTAVNSRKSQRENKLGFPILVDAGGEVAQAFGIRWTLPDELRGLYATFGVDLASFNGEGSWTLPMPARYVIGQDGVIAYAEINPDYTRRPDPSELMPTLDRLLKT